MEAKKPPIKVVSPGKVFRSDDDATHSPMFTQMEGLVVDKGITPVSYTHLDVYKRQNIHFVYCNYFPPL